MTENSPLGRLLADALQGSTPYGAGLLARPIASQGLAGLLGMQSFAQRMAAMPQPAPADTARGMLSADFGRGITADDPRVDLAMALSTATPRAGIRAYHGSPHDFDRFDMSRIGTGEGAQAYGHGLYFAGNENTARTYRDFLSQNRLMRDPDSIAAHWLNQFGRDESIQAMRRVVASMAERIGPEAAAASPNGRALAIIESGRSLPPINPSGRMYEVNLRTDPSRLLDWDAPLGQQSPHVQRAAERIIGRPSRFVDPETGPAWRWESGPMQGQVSYGADALDRMSGGTIAQLAYRFDPARAPEMSRSFLREGVPGIQYLDQGSRAAGQGTRNYVMFDDNLIEIIRKYGIAGLLGSGAGYGMLSPTQAPQNP